jgi:hypothetical protein
MATQDYWAEAPMHRHQMVLFSPSLDDMIADDDPVRLVDEVLRGLDWSAWEATKKLNTHFKYMFNGGDRCSRSRTGRHAQEAD